MKKTKWSCVYLKGVRELFSWILFITSSKTADRTNILQFAMLNGWEYYLGCIRYSMQKIYITKPSSLKDFIRPYKFILNFKLNEFQYIKET